MIYPLVRELADDGVPVAVHHCLIPLSLCPALADADYTRGSVYEILRTKAHIAPTLADCALEAASAGPAIAPLLGLDEADPVLVSRQIGEIMTCTEVGA